MWVPISPALQGAIRGIHDGILGFNEISVGGLYSGLNFEDGTIGNYLGPDLLPKDAWWRSANEQWVKDIK